MLRVKLVETRPEATVFGVPMTVKQVETRYWSEATMRRRIQGDDKKVCTMCIVFRGRAEVQTVSIMRCVLVAVATYDLGVFGPRRAARIECKHMCNRCFAYVRLLDFFNQ